MADRRVLTTAPRGLDWKAAITAGLVAGALFLLLEMILVPVAGMGSAWGPPRMIAAIVLGSDVLPPPATFNLGIFLVALVVHLLLSVVYALVLAAIVRGMTMGAAVVAGLAFGLALYLVNFYLFTALFPWFATARNWVSVLAHLAFGGVAAYAYKATLGARTRAPGIGRPAPVGP
jgi:uncharacterized membrane protein YagU involved in acid resistance